MNNHSCQQCDGSLINSQKRFFKKEKACGWFGIGGSISLEIGIQKQKIVKDNLGGLLYFWTLGQVKISQSKNLL